MKYCTLINVAFALGITSGALAGDIKNPIETAPVRDSDFSADLRLDGWIVQLDVGLTQTALGLSESVFIGFDDIISHIDWIVPLGADLRYNRFGLDTDIVALKISGATTTPGPFFDRADVEMKLGVYNILPYYRLIDESTTKFDLMGGARLLWVDLDVGLSGGPLGTALGPVSAGAGIENWDGVVAMRLQQDLGEKMFCAVYGDIGTGASDLTWQVMGSVGYRLSEKTTASVGYRYLHYEMSRNATDLGLTASGVQLTINRKF